jgi:hypothetical protein
MARIKAGVPLWMEALARGRAAAPKCGAKTQAGTPCQRLPMPGTPHCYLHLHGPARDAADARRAVAAEKLARSTNTILREQALATLRNIARRQLHRAWKKDPTLPGSTLALDDHDEARVRRWLSDTHQVDLENRPLHANGHPITARAIDRLRWAGTLALTKRITPEAAARRVFLALRDDVRYWAKFHGEPTP